MKNNIKKISKVTFVLVLSLLFLDKAFFSYAVSQDQFDNQFDNSQVSKTFQSELEESKDRIKAKRSQAMLREKTENIKLLQKFYEEEKKINDALKDYSSLSNPKIDSEEYVLKSVYYSQNTLSAVVSKGYDSIKVKVGDKLGGTGLVMGIFEDYISVRFGNKIKKIEF